MIRARFILLILALAAFSFALAACGGDDDEDQITEAIEFAATSGDPAACTEAQTLRFTEQTTGQQGAAALKQCRRDAEDDTADSVDVSNIEVDGDSATAEGAVSGSFFDGQTVAVALVKQDDEWKLDELTGFVDLDRDAFVATIEREFRADPEERQATSCVVKNLEGLSDQQFEDLFLNSGSKLEDQVFTPCFGGQ
jgi:ABC-type glycerol-3-phosphate transport system substrate-binding protein